MREVPGAGFLNNLHPRPHQPYQSLRWNMTGAALANLIHKSAHRPFLVVAFMTALPPP